MFGFHQQKSNLIIYYSHILRKPATLSINNEYSISSTSGHLLTLLMSRFCGLRSRWRTFRLWQKARPFNNWYIKDWKERIKTALSDTSNIKNVIKRCSLPPLPWFILFRASYRFKKQIKPWQSLDPSHHYSCQSISSNPVWMKIILHVTTHIDLMRLVQAARSVETIG